MSYDNAGRPSDKATLLEWAALIREHDKIMSDEERSDWYDGDDLAHDIVHKLSDAIARAAEEEGWYSELEAVMDWEEPVSAKDPDILEAFNRWSWREFGSNGAASLTEACNPSEILPIAYTTYGADEEYEIQINYNLLKEQYENYLNDELVSIEPADKAQLVDDLNSAQFEDFIRPCVDEISKREKISPEKEEAVELKKDIISAVERTVRETIAVQEPCISEIRQREKATGNPEKLSSLAVRSDGARDVTENNRGINEPPNLDMEAR